MFKKYTDDERAGVTAFLISSGYPKRRGAMKYTHTISRVDYKRLKAWVSEPDKYCGGTNNLRKKMMELKELIEKELNNVFGDMDEKRKDASYRDLTTAAGVLLDKLLVLRGDATTRTETIIDWKEFVNSGREKSNPVEEIKG